jgi:hypothetical protein
VSGVVDLLDQPEDQLVFGIESESTGSEKDFSDIGSSLARISVEVEEGLELSNALSAEDRILGADVLGKDCFELFLLDLFLGHDGSDS